MSCLRNERGILNADITPAHVIVVHDGNPLRFGPWRFNHCYRECARLRIILGNLNWGSGL
jgi:hypothetical protein